MSTTRTELRTQAAEILGILAEGETLPSYEAQDLTKAYTEVYAVLQAKNLAPWDIATIPDQYANAVATLVAEQRVVKYGIPVERFQQVKLAAQEAMATLRELQAGTKQAVTRMQNF